MGIDIPEKWESNEKLKTLATDMGYDTVMDMLQVASTDSVVPGICMNDDCCYSDDVEPDQAEGICEECDKNTVKSCLVIAEII